MMKNFKKKKQLNSKKKKVRLNTNTVPKGGYSFLFYFDILKKKFNKFFVKIFIKTIVRIVACIYAAFFYPRYYWRKLQEKENPSHFVSIFALSIFLKIFAFFVRSWLRLKNWISFFNNSVFFVIRLVILDLYNLVYGLFEKLKTFVESVFFWFYNFDLFWQLNQLYMKGLYNWLGIVRPMLSFFFFTWEICLMVFFSFLFWFSKTFIKTAEFLKFCYNYFFFLFSGFVLFMLKLKKFLVYGVWAHLLGFFLAYRGLVSGVCFFVFFFLFFFNYI